MTINEVYAILLSFNITYTQQVNGDVIDRFDRILATNNNGVYSMNYCCFHLSGEQGQPNFPQSYCKDCE